MTQDKFESQERPGPWAFHLALCLLAPLFFFSFFLSVLAPLPILYLHSGTASRKQGRLWALAAIVLGCGLSLSIQGLGGSLGFLLMAGLPAFTMGELLMNRKGVEKSIAGGFFLTLGTTIFLGWLYFQQQTEPPLAILQRMIQVQVAVLQDQKLNQQSPLLVERLRSALEPLEKNPALILETVPGLVLTTLLLLCLLPTLVLIRWNPKGFLRRAGIGLDFLRKWRSPVWLAWPTLFCILFLLLESKPLSIVARNVIDPLLLIYFFQGLSILAYFLDSLRLRGPIRILFYGLGSMLTPWLMMSFGFFDLWFNFRGRLKAKKEKDNGP